MNTAQWPQDIGLVKPMEELVTSSSLSASTSSNINMMGSMGRPQQLISERRPRPQKEQALNCPRCNSTNTKFCYYNNYSLTQPRYFCKTCRRYWTEGGSLRNVPVGGGSRKNKRSSSSSANSTPSTTTTTVSAATTSISLQTTISSGSPSSKNQNPKFQEGQDLNLAFPLPEFGDHHHFPGIENNSGACTNTTTTKLSAMELLRSTAGIQGRGLNPFMPMHSMPIPEYPSSGFGVQDFRSNGLSFSLDGGGGGGYSGGGGGYGGGGLPDGGGRLLFPFEELARPVSSGSGGDQSGGDPPGFWNGMMGGGGGGSW